MKLIGSLIAILSLAPAVFAQTATLRGQVTDESGALVPKATVTLKGPNGIALRSDNRRKRRVLVPRTRAGRILSDGLGARSDQRRSR